MNTHIIYHSIQIKIVIVSIRFIVYIQGKSPVMCTCFNFHYRLHPMDWSNITITKILLNAYVKNEYPDKVSKEKIASW